MLNHGLQKGTTSGGCNGALPPLSFNGLPFDFFFLAPWFDILRNDYAGYGSIYTLQNVRTIPPEGDS